MSARMVRCGSSSLKGHSISILVHAKVKSETRKEFLDAMDSLQSDRMKQKGMRTAELREDHADRMSFWLTDVWETEEDLQRYLRTESFKVFKGALTTLCVEVQVKRIVSREGGDTEETRDPSGK